MSLYKRWTPEEDAYLRAAFSKREKPPLEDVAKQLNRPVGGVRDRARALKITWSARGRRTPWTRDEDNTLEEYWGTLTEQGIAKMVGRTTGAVRQRAGDLGLGPARDNGSNYILFRHLIQVIYNYPDETLGGQTRSKRDAWTKKGLPIYARNTSANKSHWVIDPEKWWRWAETHQGILDFSAFEPLALGPEPDWVPAKRRHDIAMRDKVGRSIGNAPWSQREIDKLKDYANTRKYCADEIGGMIGRTASAVRNMASKLGLTHLLQVRERIDWDEVRLNKLATLIHEEGSWVSIAGKMGIAEDLCRARATYTYGTMQLDVLRSMVKKGEWGGATPAWSGQPIKLCKYARSVKTGVSQLLAILTIPIVIDRSDDYPMHNQCENWDPWRGCLRGETNCDECGNGFLRILPQHCDQCGSTFLRRGEQGKERHICPACMASELEAERATRRARREIVSSPSTQRRKTMPPDIEKNREVGSCE